ncbi:MAG: elongation factor Ts [Candidatus Saccharimonadales bacterium]|nr:elongation factor Ts [Candidatus Saccharimonadales bacterium]
MAVDIQEVKRLKELTGVGITDAKKALEEAKGNFDKALEAMRVKGLSKADKKSEREARAGIVHAYVHSDRIGVLVEVNCETDFVARTEEFKDFVHDVALHVAASAPQFITEEDIDKKTLDKERKLFLEELKESGKQANMLDKIADGKIKKWQAEVVLVNQPFIKDPDKTIGDYLKEKIAKLGENMTITQMERIELGARK